MTSSKHLIEGIYDHLAKGNVSKVLPVLDEHIRVYIPESLPFGGTFYGRAGYVSMLSKAMQTWQTMVIRPQCYFMPEDASDETLIVTGEFEAVLPETAAHCSFQIINQWRVRNRHVIELRLFCWDTAQLLHDLNQPGTRFGTVSTVPEGAP